MALSYDKMPPYCYVDYILLQKIPMKSHSFSGAVTAPVAKEKILFKERKNDFMGIFYNFWLGKWGTVDC